MKVRKIIPIVLTVCGLFFWPLPVQATPITIQIEAVVDSVQDHSNYLEGQISPGDIITGWYTYESTTPDSNPSLDVGDYEHYFSPFGIFLSVSGFDFKTDPTNVDFFIEVVNNYPSGDDYMLGSSNNLSLSNGASVDRISWQLNDPTGNVFSSDALPTTTPVLNDWQTNILNISGDRTFGIWAHVTSAVPEPSTIFLLTLGGLMLRKRN